MDSGATLRIAYDGPALKDHVIDVRVLAPALLGLTEILEETNRLFNDEKCRIKVYVTPDIEKKCFDIGLKVFQEGWTAVGSLFSEENIESAASIIDWIFRIVGSYGLIKVLVHFNKQPINIIQFKDAHGNLYYRYQFEGKEDLILDHKQHLLFESNVIRKSLRKLFSPILQESGITDFYAYKNEHADGSHVTKADAQSIEYIIDAEFTEIENDSEVKDAWLSVYSPVYDMKANKWRLWYQDEHHYMDVSDSGLKELVMANGGALIGDKFRVKLKISSTEKDGKVVRDYKIIRVTEFEPAARQTDLFLKQRSPEDEIK